MSSLSNSEKESPQVSSKVKISTLELGVYKVKIAQSSGFGLQDQLQDLRSSFPILLRLATDIYSVAPGLFLVFLACKIWEGVEGTLELHISNRLLRTIELSLREGHPNVAAILFAVAAHIVWAIIVGLMSWWSTKIMGTLEARVIVYFDLYLMEVFLKMDLPTSREPGSANRGSSRDIWRAAEALIRFFTQFLNVVSQLALIAHISRTAGGPFFVLMCIGKPFLSALCTQELFDKTFIAFWDNQGHIRMKALEYLAFDGRHKEQVFTGNLSSWILSEYRKGSRARGDKLDTHPFFSFSVRDTPVFDVVYNILSSLPMAYCAITAIFDHSKFSIASIAILQQSSSTLSWSMGVVLRESESFRRSVSTIKNVYAASNINNKVPDGHLSYPHQDADSEKGMSFELRDVHFEYPGSQNTTSALRKINLSIGAGQLVVIVGANGSGKSTLLRILSRLYDPCSGEILIDGKKASEYRLADLYMSIAILSQETEVYPLSLYENIGLGFPDQCANKAMVERAAQQGGASEFISKLVGGLETQLDPPSDNVSLNLDHEPDDHPLRKELEQLNKPIDISGGERQRLVAARSFMRFQSGNVKFVAVDEPSSALDAEGELRLFEELINERAGKTMIFVTHRFGHLTKHADKIICMKSGEIVETGTHAELMRVDGEYAKLYNIQASAFQDPVGIEKTA